MATKQRGTQLAIDPQAFLARSGEGRTIGEYRKNQLVFSQGDPADAVFYIQRGKVEPTVVSKSGKEAFSVFLGRVTILVRAASPARLFGWLRRVH